MKHCVYLYIFLGYKSKQTKKQKPDRERERREYESTGPEGLRATDMCELLQMRKRGQKEEEITQKGSSELG